MLYAILHVLICFFFFFIVNMIILCYILAHDCCCIYFLCKEKRGFMLISPSLKPLFCLLCIKVIEMSKISLRFYMNNRLLPEWDSVS